MAKRKGTGKNGKIKYVPLIVIGEIEDIKKEEGILIDAEAFRKMANNSKVTRELNKIKNNPTRMITHSLINMGKKKGKKWKYNDLGGII